VVIPIGDRNRPHRTPWVTRLLLLANLAVFLGVQPWWGGECVQQAFFLEHAAIPAEVLQGEPLGPEQVARQPGAIACGLAPVADKPVYLAILQSLFLHAGWLHLLGNLLYLWIFGNNVEDRLGHLGFAAFYLVCGVIATGVFVLQNLGSSTPLVGASGAIAGVLGAYLVMFPRARISVLVPFLFFLPLDLPAVIVLGLWFVVQLRELGPGAGTGGGVAYLAHVGGFVAGAAIVWLLGHRPAPRPRRRRPLPPGWR
jgi:membrane associated rhomboid family serine protease